VRERVNYEKWKNGINYKTNRKIKIGGKTHREFGYDNFYIRFELFTCLDGINKEQYLQETDELNKQIKTNNKLITQYNAEVDAMIDKIKLLNNWDESLEFYGNQYGIPCLYMDIHKENNCNGQMKVYKTKTHECKGCRDGMPCNGSYTCNCYTVEIKKCDKCGFIK